MQATRTATLEHLLVPLGQRNPHSTPIAVAMTMPNTAVNPNSMYNIYIFLVTPLWDNQL